MTSALLARYYPGMETKSPSSLTDRELEKKLRDLETEKFQLPYEWVKEHRGGRWDSLDYKRAEKETLSRRREILDEMKALRVERTARKVTQRQEREARAAVNRKARQERIASETSECQICEGRQCTTKDGRMVHHGYNRPGHGYIVGDCFGVGRFPYPAIDALEDYLPGLETALGNLRAALENLPNLTELVEFNVFGSQPAKVFIKSEMSEYAWNRKLEQRQWQLTGEIGWYKGEVKRVTARIKAVKP